MAAIDEHLQRHRQRVIERDRATLATIRAEYRTLKADLEREYRTLGARIANAREAGEAINPSWLRRQGYLQGMIDRITVRLREFGGRVGNVVIAEQRTAIQLGLDQAQEGLRLRADETIRDGGFFNPSVPKRAFEDAVGIMGNGSPLHQYFREQLAPAVARAIRAEIVSGIGTGASFRDIARRLAASGDIAYRRALATARTEVNRVRRESAREMYRENSDIVSEWEWAAAKSVRTCILCLAMDGKRFPLEEPFPQHVNCRCTLVPVTRFSKPRTLLGREWFDRQSEEHKRTVLGPGAYEAYSEGAASLEDFVGYRHHKTFGKSVVRKPLAQVFPEGEFGSS